MSTTSIGTNDALTVKLWGRKAFMDSVKPTMFGKLMGKGDSAVVQIKDELSKNAGDRARFRLRSLPTSQATLGSSTLEGNEEGLDYQYTDLGIDQVRHASKTDLGMTEQRSNWSVREDLKAQESDWWENYWDTMLFETLSGDATSGYSFHNNASSFGNNTITAPTTDRIVYGGNATSKATIDSSDIFDLSVIDACVEKAKLASPTFKKASFGGKKCYVLILHPYQVRSMRTNTNDGQWLDIQKAAMNGGKVSDNPIFSEALGMYNGVLLLESTRIKTFSDYGSGGDQPAARALFLGAQAGAAAFGRKTPGTSRLKWTEKTFDYGDKAGVGTCAIWGIKKNQFGVDSGASVSDYCSLAVDTYAVAAS